VELLVPSHPVIIQSKQPGGVTFELDTSQVMTAQLGNAL
jgi:hypothetical protein